MLKHRKGELIRMQPLLRTGKPIPYSIDLAALVELVFDSVIVVLLFR